MPTARYSRDQVTTDDFSDSFYYRAIRTRIGEALRTLFVPTEPAPERLLKLLSALDQPTSGTKEKQDGLKTGLPRDERQVRL
jgi:hypothetical protein